MAAQEPLLDLEVVKTDTKTWKIVVTGPTGAAIDVTGYVLFFTVKNTLTDEDTAALIQKTIICPDNPDSESGICWIALTSTDTNIAIGNYTYDIKLQKNSGPSIVWRKTVATGKFKVNLTATKRTS
jgi:hypothetical protein